MDSVKKILFAFLFFSCLQMTAQSDGIIPISRNPADKIIGNYLKNTGGAEAWKNLKGYKTIVSIVMGEIEIPMELYQTKDGRQLITITYMGQKITQNAFDGNTLWFTNLTTMQPEKSDSEAAENMKTQKKDFPTPFLDYKKKGYTVESMGIETINGLEMHKLKLTQPSAGGIAPPTVSFYYFDAKTFLLLVSETEITEGDAKGQMSVITMGDYREVDGLYFPFSQSIGGQEITIKEIVLNPPINDAMFAFPD